MRQLGWLVPFPWVEPTSRGDRFATSGSCNQYGAPTWGPPMGDDHTNHAFGLGSVRWAAPQVVLATFPQAVVPFHRFFFGGRVPLLK